MADYSLSLRIDTFKDLMIRLGDGLRMSLLAFKELQKREIYVNEDTLYNMLTDMSTFTAKKSLDHFYNYITEYLIDDDIPDIDKNNFVSDALSYYNTIDEMIFGENQVSIDLFNYLHSTLWEDIVKQAICNLNETSPNFSTYFIEIPAKQYKTFYKCIPKTSDDDICSKFLYDLETFLSFHHIIKLRDFDLDDDTLDLFIPIKFNFSNLRGN